MSKERYAVVNKKSKLLCVILSLAVLVIWGYGYYYGQYVRSNYNSVSVRMQETTVTKQDIITALDNEHIKGTEDIPVITAWKQVDEQDFECPELATTAKLSVIEFWGDAAQVMPITLVKGNMITSEDQTGCMLDENTAYRLFRTRGVIGRTLTYQNKSYCIRSIMKAKEEVLILPITDDSNTYSNLEFVYDNKEEGEQYVRAFLQQNGLGDNYTIVEGCFYARLIPMTLAFPLWLLGFFLLSQLVGKGRIRIEQLQMSKRKIEGEGVQKKIPVRFLRIKKLLGNIGVSLILVIAVLLFLRLMTKFMLPIPERYIPTKWSDFSFWVKRWEELREQLHALEYLSPVTKDIILFQAIWRCALFSLITSALALILMTLRRVIFNATGE